jgi:mRNA interferase RelE/StbE
MPDYRITFARSARRELESLDPPVARRVLAAIERLQANPRPRGCVKLAGSRNDWRIRVGDWRVIYSIDDSAETVDVSAIRHRSDAYR